MTAIVLRRALLDYARRPLNLILLVAVPAVIVIALSGELASFSRLLAAGRQPPHLEVATAGWAAAVAGLAGFFQVVGTGVARWIDVSRHTDLPSQDGRVKAWNRSSSPVHSN